MIHKARGRTSNNQSISGIREYVIELVRSRYADFDPSLAAEVLLSKDGVKDLYACSPLVMGRLPGEFRTTLDGHTASKAMLLDQFREVGAAILTHGAH
jgi:hypothetical protein